MSAHNANTPPKLLSIQKAVTLLRLGDVIAYPTEAVYGLGCDPNNQEATELLLRIKNRSESQGLILVVGSLHQITPWIANMSDITPIILKTWPGHTTWVFKKSSKCPHWISGDHDSIAIRFSNHSIIQQLTEAFGGALVSTSANPHTLPASSDAQVIHSYFPNILMLEGSIGTQQKPSTIIDAYSHKILRF